LFTTLFPNGVLLRHIKSVKIYERENPILKNVKMTGAENWDDRNCTIIVMISYSHLSDFFKSDFPFHFITIIMCCPCYMPKYVPRLEGVMHDPPNIEMHVVLWITYKNTTLSERPKSNRNIVERSKIDTPNTRKCKSDILN
jgi:hypothetical protein